MSSWLTTLRHVRDGQTARSLRLKDLQRYAATASSTGVLVGQHQRIPTCSGNDPYELIGPVETPATSPPFNMQDVDTVRDVAECESSVRARLGVFQRRSADRNGISVDNVPKRRPAGVPLRVNQPACHPLSRRGEFARFIRREASGLYSPGVRSPVEPEYHTRNSRRISVPPPMQATAEDADALSGRSGSSAVKAIAKSIQIGRA